VREEQVVVAFAAVGEGREPVGAIVRHGEHPRAAAVRAAADELGLRVEPTSVREVTAQVEEGRHVLRVVYDAEPRPGTPPPPTPPPAEPNGAPRVQRAGAYAVLACAGRILLTRLAYTKVWTLPGGGIDHGESPVEAVRREVLEETGLPLAEPRLVDVDSVHFTGHAPDGTLEDFHAVRVLYTGTVPLHVEPRVVEVGGSSDAAAWRPIAELDERERSRLAVALRHVS
jgi:ADP-ribose pyrophosphatase YjhB (NUDIX family)